jgi:hypothetical protein
MMEIDFKALLKFVILTTIVHVVTYFFSGLFFSIFFDYAAAYTEDPILSNYMRPTSSIYVIAGPLFQLLRGPIFGLILYPFYETIFKKDNGWISMWFLFIGLGILSPMGAAPGSIEGAVYTVVPAWFHVMGLPEVLFQTFAFSVLLFGWVNRPDDKRITILLGIAFILVLVLSSLGVLFYDMIPQV